jgi:GTP-binding protein Era
MPDFVCGYVAVAGRPNVGKSTLVNKLLSYPLSIVSAKPQTTRHKLLGIMDGEDHQVVFLDSPGLMVPKYALQQMMVKSAWSAMEEADLVLLMTEPREDDLDGETRIVDRLRVMHKPVVLAINKIDLVARSGLLPVIAYYRELFSFTEIVPISALKDDGLDIIKQVIIANLPHQPAFYPAGSVTDRPQRFFVAEIVRQKVFEQFGEEIPYSVAVVVDDYKERDDARDYIKATVVCERESQKAILIGKGGVAVKRLGSRARAEIEAFVGKQVFLELRVEVKGNWRKMEQSVRSLGQT